MFDFLLPLLKGALILVFLVLIALLSIYFFGRNNTLENAAEELLSKHTGHKIDFTPDEEDKDVKKP